MPSFGGRGARTPDGSRCRLGPSDGSFAAKSASFVKPVAAPWSPGTGRSAEAAPSTDLASTASNERCALPASESWSGKASISRHQSGLCAPGLGNERASAPISRRSRRAVRARGIYRFFCYSKTSFLHPPRTLSSRLDAGRWLTAFTIAFGRARETATNRAARTIRDAPRRATETKHGCERPTKG